MSRCEPPSPGVAQAQTSTVDAGGPSLVSVIVPTYNAGPYLEPALRSVLAQSYPHLEVIVLDDGSTDGSVEAARQRIADDRIRWIRQDNAGKPAAMNRALRESTGEFYVLQDADDMSHPDRVKTLLSALAAQPEVAAAYSGHELIIGDRRMAPRLRGKTIEECRRDIQALRMPAHDPTGMYRMAMVRDIPYEETLPVVEGYDYVLRVGERFPMVVVGACLYGYRVHPNSITRANVERREQLVQKVHERARERRGQSPPASPARSSRSSRSARDDNNLPAHFMASVIDLRLAGRQIEALKTGLYCSRLHLLDPHYHKALAYATLPMGVVKRLRRSK